MAWSRGPSSPWAPCVCRPRHGVCAVHTGICSNLCPAVPAHTEAPGSSRSLCCIWKAVSSQASARPRCRRWQWPEVPSACRVSSPALPTQATCFGAEAPCACGRRLDSEDCAHAGPPPGLRRQTQAGSANGPVTGTPRPADVPSWRGCQGQQNRPSNNSVNFLGTGTV